MDNSKLPSLSIILPTYNERENIEVLIPSVAKTFKGVPHEIIVVDDSSSDGTGELVLEFAKKISGLKLIVRNEKIGIGAALRDGYNNAANEIILSSDTDLSFSALDMMRVYQKIARGNYDVVAGSRYVASKEAGHEANQYPWIKRVVSRLGNKIVRVLFRIPLFDLSMNCRAIRRDTWRLLDTKDNGNFFLFEMLFLAHKAGARLGDVPITLADRRFGKSKIKFAPQAVRALGKILVFLLRR